MITVGCDIGSLFAKAVILDDDELIASKIVRTTGNMADEVDEFLKDVIREAGLSRDRIDCLGGTGAGADILKDAEFVESTLTCVGAASSYYIPETRLSIDIGGQSITSMLLDENGRVLNFMRNDKCASGSGRFLEVMSDKLDVEIEDIDQTVAKSRKTVAISNQCGVFAESEVITHVNNGEQTPDIIAGVCDSVANMVATQGRRFGMAEHYTLTGGVAKINFVTGVIKGKLDGTFHPFPFDPQLAAAIGAALLGD